MNEPPDTQPPTRNGAPVGRFYFRQLLSGRDFGELGDEVAKQMRNFVYLLGDRNTGDALVIDPAYDPASIVDVAAADGMRISGVLVTHHHPDHVGGDLFGHSISGLPELLEIVSVPVHVHSKEAGFVCSITGLDRSSLVCHSGGDLVSVGGFSVELIHTPGHTPGSQCFLVKNRLLAGDTLFLEGCGRTDFPGGDAEEMYASLTQRLAKVPGSAVLFPGHDYSLRPSAPMDEVRRLNSVFVPRSPREWLAAFGR